MQLPDVCSADAGPTALVDLQFHSKSFRSGSCIGCYVKHPHDLTQQRKCNPDAKVSGQTAQGQLYNVDPPSLQNSNCHQHSRQLQRFPVPSPILFLLTEPRLLGTLPGLSVFPTTTSILPATSSPPLRTKCLPDSLPATPPFFRDCQDGVPRPPSAQTHVALVSSMFGRHFTTPGPSAWSVNLPPKLGVFLSPHATRIASDTLLTFFGWLNRLQQQKTIFDQEKRGHMSATVCLTVDRLRCPCVASMFPCPLAAWAATTSAVDFDQLFFSSSANSTSANFDFGQFRLRPISTTANFDFGQFRLRPIFGCSIFGPQRVGPRRVGPRRVEPQT